MAVDKPAVVDAAKAAAAMVRAKGISAPSWRVGGYARRQEEVSGVSGLGGGGRTGPQGDAVRPEVAKLGRGFDRFKVAEALTQR